MGDGRISKSMEKPFDAEAREGNPEAR